MGRKAKQCAAKKISREVKVAAPAPAVAEGGSSSDGEGGSGTPAGRLPMTNLVRLMRQPIPNHAKVSASAKDLTHDCAVEFVGFVSGEAVERATAEQRRTIAPEDYVSSFQELGFDDYVGPMTTYMTRYREQQVNPAGYRGFTAAPTSSDNM